jgi:predicted TIM-barrel fold metal-dependent hydrolase
MIIDMRCRPPAKEYIEYFSIMQKPEDRPEAHRKGSMELFFEEMKAAGITQAVAAAGCNPGLKLGKKEIPPRRISNEHAAEVQNKYPERIIAVGGVDAGGVFHNPLEEIEKCKKLGIKGIFIEPGRSPGCYLNDPRLYPIYQKCQDLGMFINPQTSGPLGGANIDYGNPKYIDQVAHDFPDLTIICCHGCWPFIHEMIAVAMRRPNLYTAPDLYIRIAGANLWAEAANSEFRAAGSMFADKLIFGTAYPYVKMADYTKWFISLPWKEGVLEKILYKNAIRAMGLDASKYPDSW